MTKIVVLLIEIYSRLFSPVLTMIFGNGCRYQPTCSVYAKEAISKYGLIKGGHMAIKRLLRCHPFSHSEYFDPVSDKGRSQRVKPEGQAAPASA